ncbi:MAG: NAD(P)H-dependent oxidoreductase subunit E [Gammaproteobacteria bacterium]|nr:NAD(P)H-dependent oxidoreductase subunit E [Gammaproteobacteria bacterium]MBU4281407.1 NAD(P)H-dependent oxidoreductase subunit E [Gammaproteobacteria bacterium]MBU4321908.1 NAD(P)H-dependent oxidoreductase subunit E [Gammaproteobacteria bacterium]MBU4505172.1 NAD(P)H-dependent oxidoreductase subunit E [Gammaproteobacteria bacterium]
MGQAVNTDHKASADSALARWGHDPHALVQVLRETQALTHWLSRDLLAHIAQALRLPLAQVEGVATFYRFFHTQPVGRVRVLFSDNITDRMLGSEALLARLCERLGVSPGETDAQGRFSVDRASCTGLCDQGPALLINHHQVITRLDAARVDALAALMLSEVPLDHWPADWFHVHNTVHRADALLTGLPVDAPALSAVIAREPQALIDELARAGLRGRGGAGFPTARKWHACRDASGPLRCVVCNADEGEPGTFKDRALLSEHADAVFDGMTIAARAIGAQQGWLYLRGEYRYLLPHLQKVLERRRARGLLGPNATGLAGFHFDIGIHLGAGAYVCGEESALIESLEGRRGSPRIRPPFPVERGYLGRPTVVNNVETFCAVAHIARRGGDWWAGIGLASSTGTKIHSVSGDCERPGLYEYPMGTPIARILADCGAHDAQAVQVGGPSGTCVPALGFDRRIAFDDVPSAGAFMVFNGTRDLFEVARHFARFFAHESCGLCTPCRVGTELVVRRLDKLAQARGAGRGSAFDLERLHELDELLHSGTHCGLGASACNPLRDTLTHFGQVYASRTTTAQFEPEFDLDAELSAARRVTGRTDPGAHLHTEDSS